MQVSLAPTQRIDAGKRVVGKSHVNRAQVEEVEEVERIRGTVESAGQERGHTASLAAVVALRGFDEAKEGLRSSRLGFLSPALPLGKLVDGHGSPCHILAHAKGRYHSQMMPKKKMMDLRHGLGDYTPANGWLPPGGLTLHDMGELIRRAGIQAGFIVESEHWVSLGDGFRIRKIDWAWLSKARTVAGSRRPQVVVAFEIEGPNVPPKSVKNDLARFKASEAEICVIALYQINSNRRLKDRPKNDNYCLYVAGIAQQQGNSDPNLLHLEVRLDVELIGPNGIEDLQRRAITADGRPLD